MAVFPPSTNDPVLLDWVQRLSWRQQRTLLSGLRGPDTHHAPKLKIVVRWLRTVTQNNADWTTDYMRQEVLPSFKEVEKELEFTSVHYFAHLSKALEIIGYKHPDPDIAGYAFDLYTLMSEELLHLHIETEAELDTRLKDRRE